MTLIALMIWAGGVFAMPSRPRGFTNRIFWPVLLGAKVAEWLEE